MKKLVFACMLLFSVPVLAQAPAEKNALKPSSANTQPVEISAAKALEWNRQAKTYTARGDVVVIQGDARIESDFLTARYQDESGMTDISTLEAEGHVVIRSGPYTATGDRAVYNVRTGNAVLTGKDLRITTGEDVLTAKEKIEFFSHENKMTAVGDATAVHAGDTLSASSLSAHFTTSADGKMTADKITAEGQVTIKTAKETVTGTRGVYDISTQKAVLTGKVRILQGKNWLEGTRADVDMMTGVSRLSGEGSAASGGRVKGVFYPSSETAKPEGQKAP